MSENQETELERLRKRVEENEGDISSLWAALRLYLPNKREPELERIPANPVPPSRRQRLAQVLHYNIAIKLYKLVPLLLLTVVASLFIGYSLALQYTQYLSTLP